MKNTRNLKNNLELLRHLCRLQNEMTLIPFYIYKNKIEIERFSLSEEPFPLHSLYEDKLLSSTNDMEYYLSPEFLLTGCITLSQTDYQILIGPVSVGKATTEDARHLIHSFGNKMIHLSDLESFTNYLQTLPVISFEGFLHFLCIQGGIVNHKITNVDELVRKGDLKDTSHDTGVQVISNKQKQLFKETPQTADNHYEEQLMYYIEHGLLQELDSYINTFSTPLGRLGNNALRHGKNAAIILNSMALRSAIRGGLNPDESYKLGSVYIQQIESSIDIATLSNLSHNMVRDYCRRVANMTTIRTDSSIIRDVMMYISAHLHEKILAKDVADFVHLTPEYLSLLFYKETGQHLSAYINFEKLKEAKQLLALTKMPLAEISQYLGFSSQSYFQTTFHKYEGLTPTQFRKMYN